MYWMYSLSIHTFFWSFLYGICWMPAWTQLQWETMSQGYKMDSASTGHLTFCSSLSTGHYSCKHTPAYTTQTYSRNMDKEAKEHQRMFKWNFPSWQSAVSNPPYCWADTPEHMAAARVGGSYCRGVMRPESLTIMAPSQATKNTVLSTLPHLTFLVIFSTIPLVKKVLGLMRFSFLSSNHSGTCTC